MGGSSLEEPLIEATTRVGAGDGQGGNHYVCVRLAGIVRGVRSVRQADVPSGEGARGEAHLEVRERRT